MAKVTLKQKRVLYGLAAGLSIREIAMKMGNSPSTVEFHRAQLRIALRTDGNVVNLLRAAVADNILPHDLLAHPIEILLERVQPGLRHSRTSQVISQKHR